MPNEWFIQYRMVGFDKTHRFPAQASWQWPVYVGNDGSVLVHVTTAPARGRFAELRKGSWVCLKQAWAENGYWMVSINTSRGSKPVRVHRLVAHAFPVREMNGRDVVMHLDGDKDNNRLENLCWGSWEDNRRHENSEEIRKRKAYLQSIREGVRIELVFTGDGCRGALCSKLDLQPFQDSGKHPGSIVNWLVYLYEWNCVKVSSPFDAMPEKNQRVFDGAEVMVDGYSVARPKGFRVPSKDARKPDFFDDFACAYSPLLVSSFVRPAIKSRFLQSRVPFFGIEASRDDH